MSIISFIFLFACSKGDFITMSTFDLSLIQLRSSRLGDRNSNQKWVFEESRLYEFMEINIVHTLTCIYNVGKAVSFSILRQPFWMFRQYVYCKRKILKEYLSFLFYLFRVECLSKSKNNSNALVHFHKWREYITLQFAKLQKNDRLTSIFS